jgi:hypothetical protein
MIVREGEFMESGENTVYFKTIDQAALAAQCQQFRLTTAGKAGLCQAKANSLKGLLGLQAVAWDDHDITLYVSPRFNQHVVAKYVMRQLAQTGLLTTIRQEPPAPAILLFIFHHLILKDIY